MAYARQNENKYHYRDELRDNRTQGIINADMIRCLRKLHERQRCAGHMHNVLLIQYAAYGYGIQNKDCSDAVVTQASVLGLPADMRTNK